MQEGSKVLYRTRVGGRLYIRTTKDWGPYTNKEGKECMAEDWYFDLVSKGKEGIEHEIQQLDYTSYGGNDDCKREHKRHVEKLKAIYQDIANVIRDTIKGRLDNIT